jgi:hypothetical protein
MQEEKCPAGRKVLERGGPERSPAVETLSWPPDVTDQQTLIRKLRSIKMSCKISREIGSRILALADRFFRFGATEKP